MIKVDWERSREEMVKLIQEECENQDLDIDLSEEEIDNLLNEIRQDGDVVDILEMELEAKLLDIVEEVVSLASENRSEAV